jgi:protein gp37
MSDNSKIEWCDATWSPTTGCDRVSPGCDHCYALTLAARLKAMGSPKYQRDGKPPTSGPGFGLTIHPDVVNLPLRWRKPRKVFVNPMSDLLHAAVPDPWLADIFAVMAVCRQHTFQVLTKRHARLRALLNDPAFAANVRDRAVGKGLDPADWQWPVPNVWLGVSVEDQKWADIRIAALLDTPAAVRFISAEPLLGPVNLWQWIDPSDPSVDCDKCGEERFPDEIGAGHDRIEVYYGEGDPDNSPKEGAGWCPGPSAGTLPRQIDWIIAGGESGPGARPCELGWLRDLRQQCEWADVPFFCKQLGKTLGLDLGAGPKGGDWDAWPEDLRVRKFPASQHRGEVA